MAIRELNEIKASYKKLKVSIAKYSAKATQDHLKKFESSYKKCQSYEEKLVATLIPARKNGVTGDTLKDFKKDKNFNAVYKLLDKEVDELYKAQQNAKEWTNSARHTADEIDSLQNYITKQIKLLKTKIGPPDLLELNNLLKKLAEARKDIDVSGNLMRKSVDSRMASYVEKFNKTIEKVLDLAPKDEKGSDDSGNASGKKPVALPRPLQRSVLDLAFKKAEVLNKKIMKHCDTALASAKIDSDQALLEIKAAKSTNLVLGKLCAAQAGVQAKHAKVIDSLNDKEKVEMKKSFQRYTTILGDAKKNLAKTEKMIQKMD